MSGSSKINKIFPAAILLFVLFAVSSCKDSQSPGLEYMPDMYRSEARKAYVNYDYPDSITVRQPVAGTIPYSNSVQERFNNMPYPFPNTAEGYEAAGANLKNPLELNEATLAEGKRLYTNYCMMCHGENGKGDGILVQREKFPPPPSYISDQIINLPEGKMFHTVTFGKGLMGSHASQLTKIQRWKIIHYVQKLQQVEK
ncbi:MAG: cytochrome c [Bacteroidetes bacterium]|nr:cytochrome c [Bacteroidota bacterium]HET6244772.1 cytochrome c [Bacteroidia bacterium]